MVRPLHAAIAALLKLHDMVSQLAFWLGSAALGVIVLSYAYEVVMRYIFAAPTRWASDLVSFLLLMSVFLVAPWLTREGGHVSVTLLPDLLPEQRSKWIQRAGFALGALVCFCAGWIVVGETQLLFQRGTATLTAVRVPKWTLEALIAFGLVNSGLYFLRLAFGADAAAEPKGAENA